MARDRSQISSKTTGENYNSHAKQHNFEKRTGKSPPKKIDTALDKYEQIEEDTNLNFQLMN